jgi:hypothetical protein
MMRRPRSTGGSQIAIICLTTLLTFVACGQIPSDTTLGIETTNRSKTGISGIVVNTKEDVLYEFQYKQSQTNWLSLGFIDGSELTNWTAFRLGGTNLNERNIRIRSWKDSYGIEIPDWWQMRYFGNVGIDAYADPMGDGYNNLQKYQKGMDPFRWFPPPAPQIQVTFQEGSDPHDVNAILIWQCDGKLIPDSFTIERAHQTRRGMTNDITFPVIRHIPVGTNWHAFSGKVVTNWPPRSLNVMYHALGGWSDLVILGSYQVIAQMPGQPNIREYRYVDTNLNFYPPPVYRIQAHYQEPIQFAKLSKVTTTTISNTILSVIAKKQTNGYELTVLHPIAYARYLLLVRDRVNPQWRASGYFVSGTNRDPVHLHVDKRGMMTTNEQSPIALPTIQFLPDVVQPEFTAGWGEDSDGDTLPDIYEVLVTHTNPGEEDTGDTGTLDGYKVFADDGWNNWEKFLCRANPFQKCEPPPAVVLKEPTMSEMREAQTLKTDLPYEVQLEIRTNAASHFQPYSLWLDSHYLTPDRSGHARCDVRVVWKVPPPRP